MVERRFHKSEAGGSTPPVGTFAGVAEVVMHSFRKGTYGGSNPLTSSILIAKVTQLIE